ncbi:MAG: Fe-Mn family superoxide dismutase [Pseudomonadota bacterium]
MTNTPKPAVDPNQEHFVRGLPFKAHKIEGFAPELLERYYEDTYGGSIRSLNKIEAGITASRQTGSPTADLEPLIAKQANLVDLIALQEVFLAGLADDGGDDLSGGELEQAIRATFGDVSNWKAEFAVLANVDGTPPDWVVLAWCERFKRLQNVASVDRVSSLDLLVIDPLPGRRCAGQICREGTSLQREATQ